MAVYVDDAAHQYGRMVMCHMLADTPAELHAMARKLDLRSTWYQPPRIRIGGVTGFPHYDICQTNRRLALRLGAIEVDRRESYAIIKRTRAEADRNGWAQWSARP